MMTSEQDQAVKEGINKGDSFNMRQNGGVS